MIISPFSFAILASLLFTIAVFGIFMNRKNIIVVLMCIELMLLSVNINFAAFAFLWGDITGQIFILFTLTLAAAEAAIGLAILVTYFRKRGEISVDSMTELKG